MSAHAWKARRSRRSMLVRDWQSALLRDDARAAKLALRTIRKHPELVTVDYPTLAYLLLRPRNRRERRWLR